MWIGDTVYFLSDRNVHHESVLLQAAHRSRSQQLTRHDDFDIMNASAGPDAVVYEQAGYIHLVDTETRTATPAQHRCRRAIFRGRARSSRESRA